MENRIPFDIKFRPEIEAGKYLVVTIGGWPATIVCWNNTGRFTISATITKGEGMVTTEHYTIYGSYFDNGVESAYDLTLIPNPDYVEPAAEPSASADTFVDWAAFRRAASLQIAAGFAANENFLERSIGHLSEDIAEYAVVTADMLIKKLKGE